MKDWADRPIELKNLLNPAFCGLLLLHAIQGYEEKAGKGMPFSVSLLVLPNVLNPASRLAIIENSRSYLLKILQKKPEILIDFSQRAEYLMPYTSEGLGLVYQYNCLEILDDGSLKTIPRSFVKKVRGSFETQECLKAANLIGKKFGQIDDRATIYTSFGVRP